MPTAKEIFLQEKPLVEYMMGVTHNESFLRCLAYAKAAMVDQKNVTPEQLSGARIFEDVLLNIAEPDQMPSEFPTSGLRQAAPPPKNKQKPESTKE